MGLHMDERTIQLQQRTKQFALRIIRLTRALPKNPESFVIGDQLLRSGTAIGANYRAACHSRSKAEFIAKMGTVLEEADETIYWLELLIEAGTFKPEKLKEILKEADELTRIFSRSRLTAKS